MSNYKKLQAVLTEVFQLDQADLDFGIYRIMNQKRDAINDFLQNTLPTQVKELLAKNNASGSKELEEELNRTILVLRDAGVAYETTPKVIDIRAKLAATTSIESLEQEVFSHLANFFKRYYQGGDFISLRRYKKDVYAIPYEGEEVKLHWANHDQYYIKTSEYLKNYTFKLGSDKLVRFQLKEASTEQNNNKTQNDQERRFAIFEDLPIEVDSNTLLINFTYEPHKKTVKQDDLTKKAVEAIKANVPVDFADVFALAPTESNKQRTLLDKHLYSFVARHTFDYFIHKDLGGFLRRELDFYIKNEVLYIDDINTANEIAFNSQISKIKALKQVANKIILFLEQLENFQKKLWLKKKFVIATNYCITLDRIPADYYPEILENKAQLDEWKTLYDVAVKTTEDIGNEPFIVLDTKFFVEDFKDRLLAEFEDLDEQTNGLLINSENFQALNLLQERFFNQTTSIYIDPPYNTEGDGFVYKDSFKHSSWLSLMSDRLHLSKNLLFRDGNIFTSIDNREQENLKMLLSKVYGYENFAETFLWTKTSTPPALAYKSRKTVEYIHCYENKLNNIEYCGDLLDNGDAPLLNTGNPQKELIFPAKSIKFNIPDGTYQKSKPDKVEIINSFVVKNKFNDEDVILKGPFKWKQETINEEIEKGTYFIVKSEKFSIRFQRIDNGSFKAPNNKISIELDKKSNVDTNEGASKEIDNFGFTGFSFPKPSSLISKLINFNQLVNKQKLILDYFAGSGTTGHAVINLNRADKGTRKYILVEMGTYFNTVTKPRIQKVIYSDNWKNGKPQDKKGTSHMFKYMVLESYEDALNNLSLHQTDIQQGALALNDKVKEEYLLQYMLDVESQDHLFNLNAFKNPFAYQLNVTENNELVPTTVDLVETFNYLIGLKVQKVERIKDFKLVTGENLLGDKILVIWRNLEKTNNDDLNRFVEKLDIKVFDGEFDIIYVNGDNNLANFKKEEESWKVRLIEEAFFNKMFDVKDI